jgi:flagellar basal-body rod protein FlgG
MIDSLYIGATGMQAQQMNVDLISNNIANLNTAGFKKNRIVFEDLLYRDVVKTGGVPGSPALVHRMGVGAGVASAGKVFVGGELKKTESPLDLAVRGSGFFEVTMPDGAFGYTRSGSLQINRDGFLATADGNPLRPSIAIPSDATNVVVETTGRVLATVPGETNPIEVGQIDLVNFLNPGGLSPVGDNLYLPTEKSGEALPGRPGENGLGTIIQGFLESSNVKLIDEMISLIVAQRAYEANSKVVQASDEMLSINNNLRR